MGEAIAALWKDIGVNVKVEVVEYSVRAQKNREKSFKGMWWSDPTSTLGDPDGMMWRVVSPRGAGGYWRGAPRGGPGGAGPVLGRREIRARGGKERRKKF